jgi:tetratricopeptide (TPR) repeat protein
MKGFLLGRAEAAFNSAALGALLLVLSLLAGCNSEVLEKQAEQLRQQEKDIARQRKEIDDLLAGQKLQDQKSRDCNRAFREYFEKAQASSDRDQAIALYREGLAICPDDDVAHYELGKMMVDRGLYAEAEKEFEAAIKINPDFVDAKKQLDTVRKNR